MNSITESAVLLDTAGTVLASNQTHAQCLGQTVENILERKLWSFMPKDLTLHRQRTLDEVVRAGKSQRLETTSEGRICDSHFYPVQDRAGRVVQVAVSRWMLPSCAPEKSNAGKATNWIPSAPWWPEFAMISRTC